MPCYFNSVNSFLISSDQYFSPLLDLNLGPSRIDVFENCKGTALTTQPPRLDFKGHFNIFVTFNTLLLYFFNTISNQCQDWTSIKWPIRNKAQTILIHCLNVLPLFTQQQCFAMLTKIIKMKVFKPDMIYKQLN